MPHTPGIRCPALRWQAGTPPGLPCKLYPPGQLSGCRQSVPTDQVSLCSSALAPAQLSPCSQVPPLPPKLSVCNQGYGGLYTQLDRIIFGINRRVKMLIVGDVKCRRGDLWRGKSLTDMSKAK